MQDDYESFFLVGAKGATLGKTIFASVSNGVNTSRDAMVYDFSMPALTERIQEFIRGYNSEVSRFIKAGKPKDIDSFVTYDSLKWSRNLKDELRRSQTITYKESFYRNAAYRPYTKRLLYYADILVDEPGKNGAYFPTPQIERENVSICLTLPSQNRSFYAVAVNTIADLHYAGDTKCLPLYTYAASGAIRRDNITDWALTQFQTATNDPTITKQNVFHYVYAVLHHPAYRTRYAENLKRELPRIPLPDRFTTPNPSASTPPSPIGMEEGGQAKLVSPEGSEGFHALAQAGQQLATLHTGYETAPEYPLDQNVHVPTGQTFSWRVSKMKLLEGKTAIRINDSLTLSGIPPETHLYRLGNRSALEWLVDQYQVTTDKRSGITSDPNREGDPEYIARLVRRIVTVSIKTMKVIATLPPLTTPETNGSEN